MKYWSYEFAVTVEEGASPLRFVKALSLVDHEGIELVLRPPSRSHACISASATPRITALDRQSGNATAKL